VWPCCRDGDAAGGAQRGGGTSGNATPTTESAGAKYDAWGELTEITNADTTSDIKFSHDALGRVVDEAVTGTGISPQTAQTDLFYNGTKVVEEHQPGLVSAQYVWAPDGTLVLRDRYVPTTNGGNASPLIPNPSGTNLNERLYALTDAFGSTVAITAVNGTVLERYVYDANGRPQPLTAGWSAYAAATSSGGPDPDASAYDWQYLYHGARYLALFTNWTATDVDYDGYSGSTTYLGGGLYEYNGGSTWASTNDGRPVEPNTAAEIAGGNAYDPAPGLSFAIGAMQLGLSAIRVGSYLLGPEVGVPINAYASFLERYNQGQGLEDSAFGGVGDATGIGALYLGATGCDFGTLQSQNLIAGQRWAAAGLGALTMGFNCIGGSIFEGGGAAGAFLSCRLESAAMGAGQGALIGGALGTVQGGLGGYVQTGTWQGAMNGAESGFIGGLIGGGIAGAIGGAFNPQVCFVAGTQVVVGLTDEDGKDAVALQASRRCGGVTLLRRLVYVTRSIERLVQQGYLVARDQNDPDGPLVMCRILHVYVRIAYHLQVVTIRDSAGRMQVLRTTDEHRFHVLLQGWTNAEDLVAGDVLIEPADEASVVASSVREEHPEGIEVFNLEVEGAHTYFVRAEGSDADPVWVHNAAGYHENVFHANESPEGMALFGIAEAYRDFDPEIGEGDNVAVALVRVNGVEGHLVEVNSPHELHSEGRLIAEVQNLQADGYEVEVLSVYTDRYPCGDRNLDMNCLGNIRKEWGNIPVYYGTTQRGGGVPWR